MGTKITVKADLAVEKGPSSALTQEMEVDAYDLLKVKLPGGDAAAPGTLTVDVQPGATNWIKLLSVTSSVYDPKITYKIDGAGGDIPLDAPHVFVGAGAIGLIGATAKQFVFTNKAGASKAADLVILVGRKATP
jgi:hypothetical protein